MPTRGRPEFARRAVELFLAQDYPEKELVIVDDPRDASFGAGPVHPNIRFVRSRQDSIGARRNRACAYASGDLIAHWDDDDWHAPRRLSIQVAALEAKGARLCGADRIVFFQQDENRAWLFRSVRNPWLAGGTLVYEKSLWKEHPFKEVSDGEDVAFVDEAYRSGTIAILEDPSFYIAMLHGKNTTVRYVNSQWAHFDPIVARNWMGERQHA